MLEEKEMKKSLSKKAKCASGTGGCVYGLALIGSLVYYIQQATNFQEGLVGFFKALLWPAFLIYELLKFLQM